MVEITPRVRSKSRCGVQNHPIAKSAVVSGDRGTSSSGHIFPALSLEVVPYVAAVGGLLAKRAGVDWRTPAEDKTKARAEGTEVNLPVVRRAIARMLRRPPIVSKFDGR